MGSPAMEPLIDPAYVVVFLGPFTKPAVASISITNNEEYAVAYKVKTTNNKRFKISPAVGTVAGHASATVQVTCQPFDPNTEVLRQERFIVQTTYVPDGNPSANPREVWQAPTASGFQRKDLGVDYQMAQDMQLLSTKQAFEPLPEGAY